MFVSKCHNHIIRTLQTSSSCSILLHGGPMHFSFSRSDTWKHFLRLVGLSRWRRRVLWLTPQAALHSDHSLQSLVTHSASFRSGNGLSFRDVSPLKMINYHVNNKLRTTDNISERTNLWQSQKYSKKSQKLFCNSGMKNVYLYIQFGITRSFDSKFRALA